MWVQGMQGGEEEIEVPNLGDNIDKGPGAGGPW